jgi:hypothetical protein
MMDTSAPSSQTLPNSDPKILANISIEKFPVTISTGLQMVSTPSLANYNVLRADISGGMVLRPVIKKGLLCVSHYRTPFYNAVSTSLIKKKLKCQEKQSLPTFICYYPIFEFRQLAGE